MSESLFTIGHSTHSLGRFLALLSMHRITAVADVRSKPYSRMNPQFNREALKKELRGAGVAYVFLGKELGARSSDPSCYREGRVQYDRLALTGGFKIGLERVQNGMRQFRLALMCAEKEPIECHRSILVARHLVQCGVSVQHILADGNVESHEDLMNRMSRRLSLPEKDMFRTREELIDEAYAIQESRIAYRPEPDLSPRIIESARSTA